MQRAHGFIPRLKARGKGGIVFTASVEGLIGCPYSTAYSASKALVISLGEGLWGEMQGTGVDVLTLCPGATESEATANRSEEHTSELQSLMRISYAVFCLKTKNKTLTTEHHTHDRITQDSHMR